MHARTARSEGVTETATAPTSSSAGTEWERFEALYRSSRDDVYGYVATLLRDQARGIDVAARLGGDEFALLLPETDDVGANILLRRLLDGAAGEARQENGGARFSAGVAIYPEDGRTVEALLREGLKGTSQGAMNLMHGDALVPTFVSFKRSAMSDGPSAVVIVTDLSEQKRNQAIVAAEKLAGSILDQAAEAIVVCDAAGRIVRANSMAQLLAGRIPMLQRCVFVLPLRGMGGDDADALWLTLGAALRGEGLNREDEYNGHKNQRSMYRQD